MDNFWFWVGLTLNVGVGWFNALPDCIQAPAILAIAAIVIWLAYNVALGAHRAYCWVFIRKLNPGPMLAEKQERLMVTEAVESPLVEDEAEECEAAEAQEAVVPVQEPKSATIISIEAWLRRAREQRDPTGQEGA